MILCVEADLRVLLRQVDLTDLGERIKHARVAAGLTQSDLAGDDASIAYISRIESGQRRPDYELLAAFATRLHVSVEQLVLGVTSDARSADRLQLDYAELALRSSEPERAVDLTTDLLDRYATSPERELVERIRITRATALEVVGRTEEAMDALEGLLADTGTTTGVRVRAATALSRCYRESGDLGRAISIGETTLTDLAGIGLDGTDEALQLVATVAAAYFQRGDTTYAARLCRQAVTRSDEANSPSARAALYWNASVMRSETGDTAGALPLAERALALLTEADNLANASRLRAQLAIMQLQLDPPDVAEATAGLERALAELEATGGLAVDRARVSFYLAKARFLAGDREEADRLAGDALAVAESLAPVLTADILAFLGQLEAARGDVDAARATFQRAALTLAGAGETMDRQTAQLWLDLATLLESVGEAEEALDAYRRSAASTGLRPTHVSPSTQLRF